MVFKDDKLASPLEDVNAIDGSCCSTPIPSLFMHPKNSTIEVTLTKTVHIF